MEIEDRYRDYIPVYIDGSRDGNCVACATVFPSDSTFSMRLPDSASIFTAEIWAIIKALEEIKNASASKFIIFRDSLSCLQTLLYMKLEHPSLFYVRSPAMLASGVMKRQIQMIGTVRLQTRFIISSQSYRRCRKDEVVLCRARIGHTYLIHSYILRKDPPPLCEHCQCILTVRHILVECNHFARERKYIFGRRDVVESFRFHHTLIVLFLKQIEFYYTF